MLPVVSVEVVPALQQYAHLQIYSYKTYNNIMGEGLSLDIISDNLCTKFALKAAIF